MKAYEHIPRYTYSDYAQWEGNWELINGYPHAMSPSPLKQHQRIGKKLIGKIDALLEGENACKDCEVFYELDWIISNDTTVRPDIMIVCGKIEGDFLTFAPELIIEILSPASSLRDKNIKYQLYEEYKVKYYAIVNPLNKQCDVFELVNGSYVQNNTIGIFLLHGNCQLALDIPVFVGALNLD